MYIIITDTGAMVGTILRVLPEFYNLTLMTTQLYG